MSTSTEPDADAELVRLLDEYGQKVYRSARFSLSGLPNAHTISDAARAALLAHVAARYVYRGRLVPDKGDDLEATARGSALARYGLTKCMSYAAQVARAEALGIDPETLRMSDEEIDEHQRMLIDTAYRAGKPVIVVAPEGAPDAAR